LSTSPIAFVDAVEQKELQKLVVGQRLWPGLQKARAQALAMAVVVLASKTRGRAVDAIGRGCIGKAAHLRLPVRR
jgi:hypothetical protein